LEERGDPRAALYRQPRRTNALGVRLVLVPRGTSWMGDRGGQKQVAIPHEFYIGAYPVTQEQWQTIVGKNPSPDRAPRVVKRASRSS
jgi:formylglycine-generating enzyme required for sulfatase activity